MKKEGFTLIELLAVIVVLAIIALIATPMVLNTIDDARKGAAKSSGYGYINGLETALASYMLKNNGNHYSAGKYDVSTLNADLNVTVKGDAPSEGKVCVASNGTVSKASLKVSGYIVSYDGKEVKNTDLKEVEDITCDGVVLAGPTQVLATNGETYKAIVYLDPTDLTKICDSSNSVSATETKTGCMKWYVYKDDGTNYTMILDHNTTALVAWNSDGDNTEMKEIVTALTNDTSNWVSGMNPRLISADEVAEISGAKDALAWDSTKAYSVTPDLVNTISYFYLDGASGDDTTWRTQIAKSPGSSKYAWLYDNTYECINSGCNVSDTNKYEYGTSGNTNYVYGYWTATPVFGYPNFAWRVDGSGVLNSDYVNYTSVRGVRPVITISKDILK